ncbi:hypothetical protein MKW98_000992, partial [Papaver atlanticum]
IWILNDEDNDKKDVSTMGRNQSWTEVDMELPFQWDEKTRIEFHGVQGTDDILVETYEDTTKLRCLSLFYFNWKNTTFTKIEPNELCSSIPQSNSENASEE